MSTQNDYSTNAVISNIDRKGYKVVRVNDIDEVVIMELRLGDKVDRCIIEIRSNRFREKPVSINLLDVTAFWYRRGDLKSFVNMLEMDLSLKQYLFKEWLVVKKYHYHRLSLVPIVLGDYYREVENNKLLDLFNAKSVGLKIPDTIVSSKATIVSNFNKEFDESCISKPLKSDVNIRIDSKMFRGVGTFKVSTEDIECLEMSKLYHCPVFMQSYIDKKFEVRTFYLAGKMFSMAIFSQNNSMTKIDYRNYDSESPNRIFPIDLPDDISEKVVSFMRLSKLQTGSLDLIKDVSGEFVFLEVNPVGQYDWLSKNCDYKLDNEISNFLCRNVS